MYESHSPSTVYMHENTFDLATGRFYDPAWNLSTRISRRDVEFLPIEHYWFRESSFSIPSHLTVSCSTNLLILSAPDQKISKGRICCTSHHLGPSAMIFISCSLNLVVSEVMAEGSNLEASSVISVLRDMTKTKH